MRRVWIFAAALVAVSLAQTLHAETQTWFGFQVGLNGGSPPPPVAFGVAPHYVVVNDVFVVDDPRCDDDVFRSDGMWWRMRGGYWFRSGSWRGPWVAVDVRRVPERVLVVPARNWRHRPHWEERNVVVVREHDRGRHHGHHGHDHGDHDDD